MGRKRNPGLYKREGTWNIDKWVLGQRLCESCGTSELAEAERYLARRIEQIRQIKVYGARPQWIFRQAAIKYLEEKQHKRTIAEDAIQLRIIEPHIGDLPVNQIHNTTLKPLVAARKQRGVKNKTVNIALAIIRHILNLCAHEWLDDNGLSWIAHAPKITLLPLTDARKPYPLSWVEQERLFAELPDHLRQMALFKVNTGCREQEVCQLSWQWEFRIPELDESVFVLPGDNTKNGQERIVVLNKTAKQMIEAVRGEHPHYVFTFRGQPMNRMNNSAWRNARKRLLLPVRIHDLRHTFGMRLRAAGVTEEDRRDLLGHKSKSITTHYSAAEMGNLILAANKICELNQDRPSITLVRANQSQAVSERPSL